MLTKAHKADLEEIVADPDPTHWRRIITPSGEYAELHLASGFVCHGRGRCLPRRFLKTRSAKPAA